VRARDTRFGLRLPGRSAHGYPSLCGQLVLVALLAACEPGQNPAAPPQSGSGSLVVETDVAVPMRDGVILRADIYRPPGPGPFPTLVYRTPYGKHHAASSYRTHLGAVSRGYAVVLQDVRGRYASEGIFDPYRNEGRDGYDTIEWAARQSWSDGDVGTFGLSYPGAVQWLAALERPPSLKAMAPAMTFSSPRRFFYMNGVFDLSWLPWIYVSIAPDARARLNLPGIRAADEAEAAWPGVAAEYLSYLPLAGLPQLRDEAPYYFQWLTHPPEDPWWDWAEIEGRYADIDAAVLNLSGWHDEAYGPAGAITNHNGLVASRPAAPRSHLVIGPWKHGVTETGRHQIGDLDFGPSAPIDYDEVVLRFFDEHLRGLETGLRSEPAVRYFVTGSNAWHDAAAWPPESSAPEAWCLSPGRLEPCATAAPAQTSQWTADPAHPVMDDYDSYGPHDYRRLAERPDVLTFDSEVLAEDLTIAGTAVASVFVSCDCRDFDLWFRLLDVYPDGRAINLRSPGAEVLRASYRHTGQGRQPLDPHEVYELRLDKLEYAHTFEPGHRIRVQLSASFAPHLSRNLQTGESEHFSAESRVAEITIHHGGVHRSTLTLPMTR